MNDVTDLLIDVNHGYKNYCSNLTTIKRIIKTKEWNS